MKRAATSLIVCLIVQSLCAQMWDQLARSSYRIRQSDLRALRVEVDALTFFRDNDLSGKTIFPFTTHEGSGLGSTVKDLKNAYPKADIKEGFSMYGHDVRKGRDRVEKWLKRIGF